MTDPQVAFHTQRFVADVHDVGAFDCGNVLLNGWLARAAAVEAAKQTSSTFVWTPAEEPTRVVAYYALSAHAVVRADLTNRMRSGGMDPVPAALIGKLALDVSLHGSGHGALLLRDALERLVIASRTGPAFRVIVVDAIDDAAATFYQKYGFTAVPDQPHRLLIRVSQVSAAFGMGGS